MMAYHRAAIENDVAPDRGARSDDHSRANDRSFTCCAVSRQSRAGMNDRGELEAQSHSLLDEASPVGCAERAYGNVGAGEVSDVVDPVDRKTLECLRAFVTVHVLDESGHLDPRNVRRYIGNLGR
jgi:hypothetical protein